jgi:hypothetical protein
MALFRLLLFALGAAIAVFAGLYFYTGRTAYLTWAWRLIGSGLIGGLVFFAVLLFERLT